MKQICPLTQCIESLGGNSAVASALGLVPHAVSQAKAAGSFPAGWFLGMKDLASSRGVDLPVDLFNFRPSLANTVQADAV